MDKKIKQRTGQYFSETEKHRLIKEYLSSGSAKRQIRKKYTGQLDDGTLLRWIKKPGYSDKSQVEYILKTSSFATMSKPKIKVKQRDENFETL